MKDQRFVVSGKRGASLRWRSALPSSVTLKDFTDAERREVMNLIWEIRDRRLSGEEKVMAEAERLQ